MEKLTSKGQNTVNIGNHLHTNMISKPHGNHKAKIYNRYTYKKRKRDPNTTLKLVIKSQEKRAKEEGEKMAYKKTVQNN